MTKQEEIREGIRPFFCKVCEPADRGCLEYNGQCSMVDEVVLELLKYLHSQGCRIEVERKLPVSPYSHPDLDKVWKGAERIYNNAQQDMLKWHRDSLEPLIEEGDKGRRDFEQSVYEDLSDLTAPP